MTNQAPGSPIAPNKVITQEDMPDAHMTHPDNDEDLIEASTNNTYDDYHKTLGLSNFELNLSQATFCIYRKLEYRVQTTMSSQFERFWHFLLQSITNNDNPVTLVSMSHGWPMPHP